MKQQGYTGQELDALLNSIEGLNLHAYGDGESEIITPNFTIEYKYSSSKVFDPEENPCFRESKSRIEVQIVQAYDSEGMEIEFSHEFQVRLIEAIERNTIVE